MDALECLLTRRSVRAYREEMPDGNTVEKIVEAGRFAPSGLNRQNWHFTVISNPSWLDRMGKAIAVAMGRKDYRLGYGAPVLIVVSGAADSPLTERNASCALENLFLAAHALGLGSCWINQPGAPEVTADPICLSLLCEAGIPETDTVVGACALGYPAETPEPKPRAEGTVIYYR